MTERHPKVFNRYDIRGDYPEEIDEEFSERLGKAIASYAIGERIERVILGRDSRKNSEKVSRALKKGLKDSQIDIVDVGIGTTDRTALAAEFYGGIGVMVTASHHSWDRTGFKLIYREGYGFSNEDLGKIKDIYLQGDFKQGEGGTSINMEAEMDEQYIERMLEFAREFGNDKGKVVLDCCNGGAARTAPLIFEEAGFEIIELNSELDPGSVEPEPSPSTRQHLVDHVNDYEADIGFCYDPDADRVLAYHPKVGWLDGNQAFYTLAYIIDADKIAASIDTSSFLEFLDADIEYSRVGDVFVSAKGWSMEADLLGEPNGHFAVTDFCWYNSGTLSSLLLALNHSSISNILDKAPEIFTEKDAYILDEDEDKNDLVKKSIKYAKRNYEVVSVVDGVKFKGKDFEALLRPSGTSKKIRLMVTGKNRKTVEDTKNEIWEAIF